MVVQNHKKIKKSKFEEFSRVDFSWDFSPESSLAVSDPAYGRFLRSVYTFDPSKHHFSKGRGSVKGSR